MAAHGARALPSLPDFLPSLISEFGNESDSEDEFEGWLEPEESPVVPDDESRDGETSSSAILQRRSRLLESLDLASLHKTETPFLQNSSPSHSSLQQLPNPSQLHLQQPSSPSFSPLQLVSSQQNNSAAKLSSPPFTASPGVLPNMKGKAPIDFFRLMFDERVMSLILTETNNYASQYLEREKEHLQSHPKARAHEWCKTKLTQKELEAFIALLIAMGICGFPTLRDYWSKSWPFANNNFSSVMSSRRFELILKFLHLNDAQAQPPRGDPGYDKLYKVRPYLDTLLKNFKSSYQPYQRISIDESMISYKGRLSFLQYMPKKPHKWGMKAWVLADSRNGYTWAWKLYTGKEGDTSEHGLAHRVVMELVNDPSLEKKGYIVIMDNYYSSPALFRDLTRYGFAACGTARQDQKGIPASITAAKLKKGEVCSTQDDGVLALKWHDKRDILMLSTYHDQSMVEKSRRSRAVEGGVETIQKPQVVEEYNKFMGGVDRSNQMLVYYGFAHRSVKWWKRVFFHLLDLSLVNAYILCKESGCKLTQLQFRQEVAMSLLEGFERQCGHNTPRAPDMPLRLTEIQPFLEPTPKGTRPDCRVCSDRRAGQRHQTRYRCKGCKTPLCPYPCMERYHTLKDYKIKY